MTAPDYAYSAQSTRNPFRYALAVWRFLRSDTDDDVIPEVAIIEVGFARSRFGKRLSRWNVILDRLLQDPATPPWRPGPPAANNCYDFDAVPQHQHHNRELPSPRGPATLPWRPGLPAADSYYDFGAVPAHQD